MEHNSEYINSETTVSPKRVLAAMSGGVDSSVAAYLLRESGYSVAGVTLKMFGNELLPPGTESRCCAADAVEDAKQAAYSLEIPHYTFDFSRQFRETVVDPFIETYCAGGTPNPCIACNRHLKFGALLERAEAIGYSYLATGHYCKIGRTDGGRYLLFCADDASKDQTYMLWSLTQDQLAHTLFPLGGLKKSEVREIAQSLGFASASRPDSQDICFVPDGDYAAFIERDTGRTFPEGNFVSSDGKVLGRHKGIIHYTIGQRKGLGIALGAPAYVAGKDPFSNTVTLTDNEGLFERSLDVKQINLIAWEKLEGPVRVQAKIRYRQEARPATVYQTSEDTLHVEFDEPQRAIAPGQSFVMYDGDCLCGGGIIA